MKRKLVMVGLILALAAMPLAAACAAKPTPTPTPAPAPTPTSTPAPTPKAEEIVWKALSWQSRDDVKNIPAMMFINGVNEALKGEFRIDFKGGPEVVSPFELHKAVQSGVVEFGSVPGAYYAGLLPLADAAYNTTIKHAEIAKTGYFELQDQMHQTKGLKFVGESHYDGLQYHIYTNIPVKTLGDLAGKKMRVFAAVVPVATVAKASPVTMALGEIYTAMQQGVIDAFVMTMEGVVPQYHWDEVTKYVITPGVFWARLNMIANLNAWNKLPESLRTKIMDVYHKLEPAFATQQQEIAQKSLQEIKNSKMQIIELPPSEADAFVKAVYELAWEDLIKKDAVNAPKLKAMILK
ncbi:MAG: TRAP transporter substrate-binding protein DctP [Chloroflexi bacterium]|nr:TRAP transporter substrate-binding protein DctP [Chloroflexota bacterium]